MAGGRLDLGPPLLAGGWPGGSTWLDRSGGSGPGIPVRGLPHSLGTPDPKTRSHDRLGIPHTVAQVLTAPPVGPDRRSVIWTVHGLARPRTCLVCDACSGRPRSTLRSQSVGGPWVARAALLVASCARVAWTAHPRDRGISGQTPQAQGSDAAGLGTVLDAALALPPLDDVHEDVSELGCLGRRDALRAGSHGGIGRPGLAVAVQSREVERCYQVLCLP